MDCPNGHGLMQPLNSLHNPDASEYFCRVCRHSEKMPNDIVHTLNQQERMMRAQQAGPRA